MFTGLIETLGTIRGIRPVSQSVSLTVAADCQQFVCALGDSVAVNGVCLTVERIDGTDIVFTAVQETIRRTTLGKARAGLRVNLERALRADGRLDGHFVLGHVDGVGKIVRDTPEGGSVLRTVQVPAELLRFLAEKGSVTLDGVSLTVAAVGAESITVALVPHTLRVTTLSQKVPGDEINVECDVLARYLERLAECGSRKSADTGGSLYAALERSGF